MIIIGFVTAVPIGASAAVDPVRHYVETGEWLGPDGRDADAGSPPPEPMYSTPEEEQAAKRVMEEERVIAEWERLDSTEKLRKYDELALEARAEFNKAENVPAPFASPQGYILFPYGPVVPRIVCRPYRVIDIALEPGEEILGIHAGDTVRWTFSPSTSMQGQIKVNHIVIKPTMPGIGTNLMVHTDRRAYQIDLISSEKADYTPGVAFTYPNQNLNMIFGTKSSRAETPKEKQTGELTAENINAGYRVETTHKVDWKPLSVFDDGEKTYIHMPSRISEAPALYIRLDGKDTLVNYRVHGRYYIVDRLFDRAVLRVGARSVILVRGERLADANRSGSITVKKEK